MEKLINTCQDTIDEEQKAYILQRLAIEPIKDSLIGWDEMLIETIYRCKSIGFSDEESLDFTRKIFKRIYYKEIDTVLKKEAN